MSRLSLTKQQAERRATRVRKTTRSTTERPRLSVHVSSRHITVQIIDDTKAATVASSTTVGQKQATGTLSEKAIWVGADIAKKAKAAKIKQVVFDRGSKLYHGRVKALAEAARKEGLEF